MGEQPEAHASELTAQDSHRTTQIRYPLIPEVLSGQTADVYFVRTAEVLRTLNRNPRVGMEIFPGQPGIASGTDQVLQLLDSVGYRGEVWALSDGEEVRKGEAAVEMYGPYLDFGVYETAILGILASCTGWATAARRVVEAAGETPVISFGARHIHPNVAGIMDAAAVVGGCVACSTPLGAALSGTTPSGTMSHAFILIVGDTVEAAEAFNQVMPPDVPRVVLVDTFQDEAVESVRVAEALGPALQGVRLDTASERGGVTPGLVKEVRTRLDMAGFTRVEIFVSGGVTPERIRRFKEEEAPVDGYGVGSYITAAPPIDYTADIREIEGRSVAKLGRIPGMQRNPRLRRRR
ncbi:MAG TPA: nicotinate phosphoribosyltransferase [Chloroflexota bacterium]|nr:nicotinate phosphoribosyltransferase [Chloroflexota bacterium]